MTAAERERLMALADEFMDYEPGWIFAEKLRALLAEMEGEGGEK